MLPNYLNVGEDENYIAIDREYMIYYGERLCFLWEQYIKILALAIIMSGATVALCVQVLLSEKASGLCDKYIIVDSMYYAGIGGLAALACRWLSQIIMERQVYGIKSIAIYYFSLTETDCPSAIKYHPKLTNWMYRLNNIIKFFSAGFLIYAWWLLINFAIATKENF